MDLTCQQAHRSQMVDRTISRISNSFALTQHRHGIPATSTRVLHCTPSKPWLGRSVHTAFFEETCPHSCSLWILYGGLQALQTGTQSKKGVCVAIPWRGCWSASSPNKVIRAPQCIYGDCLGFSSGQKANEPASDSISDVPNCHILLMSQSLRAQTCLLSLTC